MGRAMVISVGTGVGAEPEAGNSLAGGIAYSIRSINPDTVYFITSRESREKTLPRILSIETPRKYEVFEVSDPDKIKRIFDEVRPLIEKIRRENKYMAVDFTSGTKAMTSTLAILGTLYEADALCNVVGTRFRGVVQSGTEELQTVNPTFAIAEKKLITSLEFFNTCQYDSSLSILEEVEKITKDERIRLRTGMLKEASKAYSAWDKFRHAEALEHLKKLGDPAFDKNKRFLGRLKALKEKGSESAEAYPLYIADLYNNALRRGGVEKKYDDAVARLYRTTELLSQYRLKAEHGIDTSNIPIDRLPETLSREWENKRMEGPLRIGLFDGYRLLAELGDGLGEAIESPKLRDLLKKRNESILAHGLTPVDEATYSSLRDEVYKMVGSCIKDFDSLISDSEFPRLDHLPE